jgi:hypothetical protein
MPHQNRHNVTSEAGLEEQLLAELGGGLSRHRNSGSKSSLLDPSCCSLPRVFLNLQGPPWSIRPNPRRASYDFIPRKLRLRGQSEQSGAILYLFLCQAPGPDLLLCPQRPWCVWPLSPLGLACGSGPGLAVAMRRPHICPCLLEGLAFPLGWGWGRGHSFPVPRICQLSRDQVSLWQGGSLSAGSRRQREALGL